MPEVLPRIAKEGGHVAAMLVELDICRETFYTFTKKYKAFGEAYEKSKIISQAFYEKVLLKGALGEIERFNFNSVAMILNNKCPDEYKRSANTEINYIGSINNLKNLDSDSLDKQIARLSKLNNLCIEQDAIHDSEVTTEADVESHQDYDSQ